MTLDDDGPAVEINGSLDGYVARWEAIMAPQTDDVRQELTLEIAS